MVLPNLKISPGIQYYFWSSIWIERNHFIGFHWVLPIIKILTEFTSQIINVRILPAANISIPLIYLESGEITIAHLSRPGLHLSHDIHNPQLCVSITSPLISVPSQTLYLQWPSKSLGIPLSPLQITVTNSHKSLRKKIQIVFFV